LSGGGRDIPEEYAEMKFCEYFKISPLDYARLPLRKISLWNQMLTIENSMRNKKEEVKIKK